MSDISTLFAQASESTVASAAAQARNRLPRVTGSLLDVGAFADVTETLIDCFDGIGADVPLSRIPAANVPIAGFALPSHAEAWRKVRQHLVRAFESPVKRNDPNYAQVPAFDFLAVTTDDGTHVAIRRTR